MLHHFVKTYSRNSWFASSPKRIVARYLLRMRDVRMATSIAPPSEDFSNKLSLQDLVTEHLYYTDTELCECKGKIIGARLIEFQGKSRDVIILDQTVMHPQGG